MKISTSTPISASRRDTSSDVDVHAAGVAGARLVQRRGVHRQRRHPARAGERERNDRLAQPAQPPPQIRDSRAHAAQKGPTVDLPETCPTSPTEICVTRAGLPPARLPDHRVDRRGQPAIPEHGAAAPTQRRQRSQRDPDQSRLRPQLDAERRRHAVADLAGERDQVAGPAAAAVGERERVLGGDPDRRRRRTPWRSRPARSARPRTACGRRTPARTGTACPGPAGPRTRPARPGRAPGW